MYLCLGVERKDEFFVLVRKESVLMGILDGHLLMSGTLCKQDTSWRPSLLG